MKDNSGLRAVFAEADGLLMDLGRTLADLDAANRHLAQEVEVLRARWQAKIEPLEAAKAGLEKQVRELAKVYRDDIFASADRLDLPHGALLYELQRRVKRARGVLERLEAEGFLEAVKVAKSVDWDQLETWPEERLIYVGTERVTKEVYAYEVKNLYQPERREGN